MPIIQQFDCPYCHTKSAGFQAVGSFTRKSIPLRDTRSGVTTYQYEDWFLLSCGKCKKCITAWYNFKRTSTDRQLATILAAHGTLQDFSYTYIDHLPKITTIGEPDFVPEKVLVPFRQAISNIASSNWDAAGTMARKTLEVATKDIVRQRVTERTQQDQLIQKTWLKGRIQKLHALGFLTAGLSDLAFAIKDEGDGATHEEEPYTQNEAYELVEYSRALLTYVYTIPGMVEHVKSRKTSDANDASKLSAAR